MIPSTIDESDLLPFSVATVIARSSPFRIYQAIRANRLPRVRFDSRTFVRLADLRRLRPPPDVVHISVPLDLLAARIGLPRSGADRKKGDR
jgi:hypothetical protein